MANAYHDIFGVCRKYLLSNLLAAVDLGNMVAVTKRLELKGDPQVSS